MQERIGFITDFTHNDGINYAYSDTDLIDWILAQRKDASVEVPECLSEMF